jgi:DNA-binding winged helix-turn-helix (wHTH) protein/tetratricopeptide (TPR) repeat protein
VRVGNDVLTPEPKVFELLSYLMRHSGRVVSKAELLSSLWAGDVVGESVLTRCMSCARKLLADDSKTPRFIRTLHGRGYEFIAPVSVQKREGSSGPVPEATEPAGEAPAPALLRERPFVGRKAEAARLIEALLELEARQGNFILVSGEAGIGKTRLLEEAAQKAPPSVDLHVARATAVEGAPALLVWQQCLRSIVRSRSIKVVLRAFEGAPSGARRLLLGTDAWQAEDQLGWDSPAERFRTFDAILRGLSELAEQRPLALFFDDLHAADLVSLLLLEFLVQSSAGPLLIVGAARDVGSEPDGARKEALTRLRGACKKELLLSGLNADEVRQFVELRVAPGREQLASSLSSRTGGNPFFLSVLTQTDDAMSEQGSRLPTAVRQAVSQRLAALEPASVELLQVAALLGSSFAAPVLSRAAGLSPQRCQQLLTSASAARVLVPLATDEYRFAHDLIREVLSSELGADKKPLLHLAVGRALQGLPEYHDARHAALLAHHFVAAAQCGGASSALDLSIRAGAYALRNLAYEEAVEHFSRASRLLSLTDSDPATECALLLDLGLSQISCGQREVGQGTLLAAAEKARDLDDASELGTVALNLAPGLFAIETGVYDPTLVGLLREALQQTPKTEVKRRALLLARLAVALYWSDTFTERVALCNEARALADEHAADDVRAAVATAYLFALLRPSNLEERRTISDQALELCRRSNDHQGLLMIRLLRAAMCLEVADLAGARFETDAFRALAELSQQPQAAWIVQAQRACHLLLDGRLDQVEQLAGACLVAGQRVRDHNALLTFGVHLAFVRIEQDRAVEVLEVIRDYSVRYPRIVAWRVVYCYMLLRAGKLDACRAEYESLKITGFSLPDDLNWMVSMALLSEICHRLGDADGAGGLYERLRPYASRLVVTGCAGIMCSGSVERALALLSAALGRDPAAREHFERALAENRRVSATLPLLQTLCDYADWLRATGSSAAARAYYDEAAPLIAERNLTALASRLWQG